MFESRKWQWLLTVCFGLFFATSATAYEYPFKVETSGANGHWQVVAKNTGPAPIYAVISLASSKNISSDRSWPVSVLVPSYSNKNVVKINQQEPRGVAGFSLRTTFKIGDPDAVPDLKVLYRLPFQDGLQFRVSQANGGPITTHNEKGAMYAVDFPMPVGTPIVAARGGTVIDIVRPNKEGSKQAQFLDKANYVRILHDDGIWATYAHLLHFTSELYLGQRVKAGDPIGQSGNSGYSSGPHLHFVIQKNGGKSDISIPFSFYNQRQGSFVARYGDIVAADYTDAGSK